MKKLRLELESVRVESFETGDGENRGTVVGHITAAVSCYDTDCCTPNPTCPDTYWTGACECGTAEWTCAPQATCVYSCRQPCP